MKNIIYTLTAISGCLLLGKLANYYINSFPASLFGMVFYSLFLQLKVISAPKVMQMNNWIIKHMGVCFVPPGLGIINHYQLIKSHGIILVTIIFVTTFILLTLVGLLTQINENKKVIKQ